MLPCAQRQYVSSMHVGLPSLLSCCVGGRALFSQHVLCSAPWPVRTVHALYTAQAVSGYVVAGNSRTPLHLFACPQPCFRLRLSRTALTAAHRPAYLRCAGSSKLPSSQQQQNVWTTSPQSFSPTWSGPCPGCSSPHPSCGGAASSAPQQASRNPSRRPNSRPWCTRLPSGPAPAESHPRMCKDSWICFSLRFTSILGSCSRRS